VRHCFDVCLHRCPQPKFVRSVFFFSSRRRHTRFDCDWSSDVCSSDLPLRILTTESRHESIIRSVRLLGIGQDAIEYLPADNLGKIGRASCRERGVEFGGGRSSKKKKKASTWCDAETRVIRVVVRNGSE